MRFAQCMWLLVLFDLPNVTDAEKRAHTRFRHYLLSRDFTRLQWSVYARAYPRDSAATTDRVAIEYAVPPGGRVRILGVTDMQFERMICIDGGARVKPEEKLEQIVIFD